MGKGMSVTAENMSVPAAELMIVGHHDKPPGYAIRRSAGSPSWLLMWTQAGAGSVEQSGTACLARPGDLVVLGSRAPQHYRVAPGHAHWRFWWAHFQPRPSWQGWLAPHTLVPGFHLVAGVPAALHPRILAAFHRAHHDARLPAGHPEPVPDPERGPGDAVAPAVATAAPARELVLGALEEILVLATSSARAGEEPGDPRVARALALIAAEPGARHSVASLAGAVALSPSRFAHLFAAETGRTPMRAVREARVWHAARLLEATDLDIAQIATASGFVSPFHFSRAFRQEFGLSPRGYRGGLR